MPPRRSKKDSTLTKVEKEIADRQARLEQEMSKLRVVIEESPKRLQEIQERERQERISTIRGRVMERPGSLVDPRHAGASAGSRSSSGRNGKRRNGPHPAVFQFLGMCALLAILLAIAAKLLF